MYINNDNNDDHESIDEQIEEENILFISVAYIETMIQQQQQQIASSFNIYDEMVGSSIWGTRTHTQTQDDDKTDKYKHKYQWLFPSGDDISE